MIWTRFTITHLAYLPGTWDGKAAWDVGRKSGVGRGTEKRRGRGTEKGRGTWDGKTAWDVGQKSAWHGNQKIAAHYFNFLVLFRHFFTCVFRPSYPVPCPY